MSAVLFQLPWLLLIEWIGSLAPALLPHLFANAFAGILRKRDVIKCLENVGGIILMHL